MIQVIRLFSAQRSEWTLAGSLNPDNNCLHFHSQQKMAAVIYIPNTFLDIISSHCSFGTSCIWIQVQQVGTLLFHPVVMFALFGENILKACIFCKVLWMNAKHWSQGYSENLCVHSGLLEWRCGSWWLWGRPPTSTLTLSRCRLT